MNYSNLLVLDEYMCLIATCQNIYNSSSFLEKDER